MVKVSETMYHTVPLRNLIACLSVLLVLSAEILDMVSLFNYAQLLLSTCVPKK